MFEATLQSDLTDDVGPFGSAQVHSCNPSDKHLQRAEGSLRMVLGSSEQGTHIMDVFQKSPIRVLFPRALGSATQEAVLVNTAGGIAGGDRLEFDVTALGGASIAVTSQAAEKIYRALDQPARIATKLQACEAAKLAWLPQETIVFNRARVIRETEIEVTTGAELLALEWLGLGRTAYGEEMDGGQVIDSWRVKIDARLIWADSFRLTDDIFPHLRRKALLSNCKAVGTLIYFGPHLETRLESLREIARLLECQCFASSICGLIVVRFAAELSSSLRLALRSFLQQLSREFGPGPFRMPKMWSC
jgi:urease accessory protein